MRLRLIENKGALPERTMIIPSWADTTAIQPGPKRNAFAETHGLTDDFVVMHSGNIGLSQGLEHIVEAAALLSDVPRLKIVFQGEGVTKLSLQEQARALGLGNLLFLPYAPKDRLGESFAAADAFVVSLQQGMAGYIVPSKLYGILASGRPYVAAVEPTCEVASITARYQCGLVAVPENARSLADRILELYRDRDLAARLGTNARVAAMEFDRAVQVRRYYELLQSLVKPAPKAVATSMAHA